MIKDMYLALQAQINLYNPEIKTVALWNNQFNRSNGTGHDGRKEKPFNYPACFLEFNNFQFRQLSLGIQEFDFNLIVHFGWKSLLSEDLKQLDELENLYYTIQRFQNSGYCRLSRISEVWDTDRTDVGITTISYKGYGRDTSRYVFKDTQQGIITGATITIDPVQAFSGGTNWYSGDTTNNGDNEWYGGTLPLDPCNNN